MKRQTLVGLGGVLMLGMMGLPAIAQAEQPLTVVYPPEAHTTTAAQIFLIGTAPTEGVVTVNGEAIARSEAGHFAPSFPLQLGENTFVVRYDTQTITIQVTRQSLEPVAPEGVAFGEGSLWPVTNVARQPGERICFGAIAPANATVSVSLADQTLSLQPQANSVTLQPNSAVLTHLNQPIIRSDINTYQGCTLFQQPGELGTPLYTLTLGDQTIQQVAVGTVEVLSPATPQVIEVAALSGTARTGPSTDYSRLTPLPAGTRAAVTGREGDWLRLDYGGWIRAAETQLVPQVAPPQTLIRGVQARQVNGWTEVVFPVQVRVPVMVQQGDRTLTLTLYNTTAQTDTIYVDNDPVIQRLDWQQAAPGQVRYTLNLTSAQQWGYKLHYEGTSLILSLRHPPDRSLATRRLPLRGVTILLDAGHGGPDDLGARGPTGYPEKDVALTVTQLVRDRLEAQGATVVMTREADIDLYPNPRADLINQTEPTIALSLHYNALPDDGDALQTAGIGTFWYQTQAHSLAAFLHDYLVDTLDRPSYGVYWNNLALTRPAVAPSVLLELGFMINPVEFEWIIDPEEQERLAQALAEGITRWIDQSTAPPDR